MSDSRPTIDLARPEFISQLRSQFPSSVDHLIPFALLKTDGGWAGLQQANQPDDYFFEISEAYKVMAELRRWLNPIRHRDARLPAVSAALGDLVQLRHPEADVILARTARMFLLLEALVTLVPGDSATRRAVEALRDPAPKLFEALDRLQRTHIRIRAEDLEVHSAIEFYTSPLLLLIVAIGESQCEYFRPHRWEVYSAGRAREDIGSRWPSLPTSLIDFITYLIQFQSAPGQYSRRTGSSQFVDLAAELAERSNGLYEKTSVLDTARLLGFLEEARNRSLPGAVESHARRNELPINKGADRQWDGPNGFLLERNSVQEKVWPYLDVDGQSHLEGYIGQLISDEDSLIAVLNAAGLTEASKQQDVLKISRMTPATLGRLIFSEEGGSNDGATWGYFRFLELGEPHLDKFKKMIRTLARGKFDKEFGHSRARLSYSLGRSQVEGRMRGVLATSAKRVIEGDAIFDDLFRLDLSMVPSCDSAPEYTVEVTLRTHLAGEALLFPTRQAGTSGTPRDKTAGALFAHLFERALDVFGLRTGALRETQKLYVPYPLLGRILDVVYRLRPKTCGSVTVTFGQHEQTSIPIPLGLADSTDESAIHCIVNYVHACILNRAMSRGLKDCSLSFDNLLGGGFKSADGLTAEGWKARIEECRSRNKYDLLFETYLPLYNKDGRCIELLSNLPPPSLKSIPIPELAEALRTYLDQPSARSRNALLVGVDVGGTFTKLRVYQLDSGRFVAMGLPFRLLTPTGENSEDPGEEFATRLVDAIVRHLLENVPRFRLTKAAHDALSSQGVPSSLLAKLDPLSANSFTPHAFCAMLSKLIDQQELQDWQDQILEHTQYLDPWDVLAIGISWPGPVRANRVAGFSGILARLGLKGKVAGTSFDDLFKLDVVENVRTELQKRQPRFTNDLTPYVALINDGNADGTGALLHRVGTFSGNAFESQLVVVKLGTGTAGAVFRQGRLDSGLTEWGKMVLDLNAGWSTDDFPSGIANLHLSAKTLPALIKKHAAGNIFPNVTPDWDSRELGLILEVRDRGSFNGLWEESGLREYASRGGWPEGVTLDIFKQVLSDSPAIDPESFRVVQTQLEALGSEARAELQRKVWIHGGVRLQRMLGLSPDVFQELLPRILGLDPAFLKEIVLSFLGLDPKELQGLLQDVLGLPPADIRARLEQLLRLDLNRLGGASGDTDETLPSLVRSQLEIAHKAVADAAKLVGTYLGDFIVLLYDIYGMRTVIATGGVLSGETGRRVREEAASRVKLYGLTLTVDGAQLMVTADVRAESQHEISKEDPASNCDHDSTQQPESAASALGGTPGPEDFATLGAAAFAAGEQLFDLKRQGLNLIKSQILKMQPGERLTIANNQVTFAPSSSQEPLDLGNYALTQDDVSRFLEAIGVSLGLYRSSRLRIDTPSYTRWVIGQ